MTQFETDVIDLLTNIDSNTRALTIMFIGVACIYGIVHFIWAFLEPIASD